MQQYLAFLRGINVGGKSLIKMSQLQECLLESGFSEVRTYIQSGNVIFSSESLDKKQIASEMMSAIKQKFNLNVAIALFSKEEWLKVIDSAPPWWGKDKIWKHNILILIKPEGSEVAFRDIGKLIPGVESLKVGEGVLYQSISKEAAGRGVTGSKLISSSAYSVITIRNYNTATKLTSLFYP